MITDKRCWTEINLLNIVNNYRVYKKLLPESTYVMAVVKADAYGHGDKEVAGVLQNEGCYYYAVATIEEGIKLRENGIKGQILILGYTPLSKIQQLVEYDIVQAIVDEDYAEQIWKISPSVKGEIALDTGMNRIGLDADNPDYCEKMIRKYKNKIQLMGVFTHLCVADTDEADAIDFTNGQIRKYEAVVNRISDLALPFNHCLNSAGGIWHKCGKSTLARLGIILYGLKPDYTNTLPKEIKSALSWNTVVSMVKKIHAGESIGYGRSFFADKEMLVATICVGYADGYNRLLSNNYYVLINGKKAPIVGRICMDQTMVDVTEIPDVQMGSKVTLIGQNGEECITADDMAKAVGSIGYEIVCDISNRVERIFI